MDTTLSSTPSSPRSLQRQIGGLFLRLDAEGLVIHRDGGACVELSIEQALCLLDFARTAGVRQLVNRAWLAEQFQAGQAQPGDDERRHKLHAGRSAA